MIPNRTFVTSDLHFEHRGVSGTAILDYTARGRDGELFLTVDEMNEAIIDNWNTVVNKLDSVLIIGDIVMGQRSWSLELVERLHGYKYLIPGNHDYVHPMYRDGKKYYDHVRMYQDAGLVLLPEQVVDTTDGITFRMCHFPYFGDSREDEADRYPEWRPIDDGMLLLHGHTHSQTAYRGHQCDVGMDAWECTPQLLSHVLKGFEA